MISSYGISMELIVIRAVISWLLASSIDVNIFVVI